MLKIGICNTKGGVGKSTIAASLAVRAAKDSPRVALVDLDPGEGLTKWWRRRGSPENPSVLVGAESASDAVEFRENKPDGTLRYSTRLPAS